MALALCAVPRISFADTPGTIHHLAGGSTGDGGAPTEALVDPTGMVMDAQGNLYIADSNHHRIRRVDWSNGIITTIAGIGVSGYNGDGIPASEARLTTPTDVALDWNGNLVVADRGNNRVRLINLSTGIISTIAGTGTAGYSGDGGAATAAKVNSPRSLTVGVGSDHSIYIADTNNHRVRKIASNGVISTFAGTGVNGFSGDGGTATNAKLSLPWHVRFDGSGNLYVADFGNYRVRKIDTGRRISTFAGSGTYGFCGDGGPATGACFRGVVGVEVYQGSLLITDGSSYVVRSTPLSGGTINTVAGTPELKGFAGDGGPAREARLDGPRGLASHADLGFFIADGNNQRVRWVDTRNIIDSFAGNGGVPYGGDGGPAAAAMMYVPTGVDCDSAGNVYVADTFNHAIRKISTNGIITTVAGTGNLGYSGDGGSAVNAQLNSPADVGVDGQGNLYISDTDNSRVRKVSANGTITTLATVTRPAGIAVTSAGTVYVAEQSSFRIKKITPSGSVSNFAGNGSFGFSGDGGPATAATLRVPKGVAVDPQGNVYIADELNDRIRKVNTAGIISTFAGGGVLGDLVPATQAALDSPSDVSVDPDGNVYIVDRGVFRVRAVDGQGIIHAAMGTGISSGQIDGPGGNPIDDTNDDGPATLASFGDPRGIAFAPSGNAYVSDSNANTVRWVFDPSGVFTTTGGGSGSVSGRIYYYANGAAVPSTTVQMTGPETPSVNSDGAGNYGAIDLSLDDWTVRPRRLGGVTASVVSPLDASYVLQAIAGLRTFTNEQNLACDVTGNGTLSTLDASLILQRALGLSNSFDAAQTCGSDWLFVPVPAGASNQSTVSPRLSSGSCTMGSTSYGPLAGDLTGQDFHGILLGDCTGNWGGAGAAAALSTAALSSQAVEAADDNATVVLETPRRHGRNFRVAVSLRGSGNVQALQLLLRYDADKLKLRRIRKVGAAARDAMLRTRDDVPGVINLALASGPGIDVPARRVLILDFIARDRNSRKVIDVVSAAIDEESTFARVVARH